MGSRDEDHEGEDMKTLIIRGSMSEGGSLREGGERLREREGGRGGRGAEGGGGGSAAISPKRVVGVGGGRDLGRRIINLAEVWGVGGGGAYKTNIQPQTKHPA